MHANVRLELWRLNLFEDWYKLFLNNLLNFVSMKFICYFSTLFFWFRGASSTVSSECWKDGRGKRGMIDRGGTGTLFWIGFAFDSSLRQLIFISSMPFYFIIQNISLKLSGKSRLFQKLYKNLTIFAKIWALVFYLRFIAVIIIAINQ